MIPGNESWSCLHAANKSDRDNSECLFKSLTRSRDWIGALYWVEAQKQMFMGAKALQLIVSRQEPNVHNRKSKHPRPHLFILRHSYLHLVLGLPWGLLLVGHTWNIYQRDTQGASQLDSWVTIFGSSWFRGAAAQLQAPPGWPDFSLQPWGRAHRWRDFIFATCVCNLILLVMTQNSWPQTCTGTWALVCILHSWGPVSCFLSGPSPRTNFPWESLPGAKCQPGFQDPLGIKNP